jgi:preprotein translocase subunit SecF
MDNSQLKLTKIRFIFAPATTTQVYSFAYMDKKIKVILAFQAVGAFILLSAVFYMLFSLSLLISIGLGLLSTIFIGFWGFFRYSRYQKKKQEKQEKKDSLND